MSQQDQTDKIIVNHKVLKQVADELLPPSLFRGINSRRNATWKPRMVVLTVMLMLVSGKKTLSAGFELGRKAAAKIFRWHQSPGESYQGFVTQLRKWHFELKLAVMLHLQEAMHDRLSDEWTIGGFVVMACDGSRVELSRTRSLENTYSPKKKKGSSSAKRKPKRSRGKGKKAKKKAKAKKKKTKSQSAESIKKKANSPQMWLTLMWHVGSGLPWDWRTGPSDSSERQHVQEMLPNLPQNTLMTADSGFVGYDFWSQILQEGHDFVIRVGANVKLLKNLGCARQYDDTVDLWPNKAASKELAERAEKGPAEFEGTNAAPLSRQVLKVWIEQFAWNGQELLQADVVVGDVDEDEFVDVLAEFLWTHRHQLRGCLSQEEESE